MSSLELQVDGTHGSAVAGLRHCAVQHRVSTPAAVWNPDLPDPVDYPAQWTDVPDNAVFDNGFKAQWEQFLRAAAEGTGVPVGSRRGRQGRAAGRAGPAVLGRGAPGRRPAAGGLTRDRLGGGEPMSVWPEASR